MEKELFRLPVEVLKADNLIETKDKSLFIGSCFANNMGKFMDEARFPVMLNPFGVLYNPMSIANTINSLINPFDKDNLELEFNNGLWHSFFHHGMFSRPTQEETIAEIQNAVSKTALFLKETHYLVLTFGTSYVYEHKEKARIVANCHKFDANMFNRYLLEPDEIVETYTDLIVRLRVYNPSLKIILTVSPVRHLKDGAHGNQISKSALLLAIEKIVERFDGVVYFPAYEIVMDELRDYRFYDAVMIQPNETAIKYIWEKFVNAYFSDEAQNYYNQVQKIIKARNHRLSGFVNENSRTFIYNTLKHIDLLISQFPYVLLEQDRKYFLKILDQI
jgi:hypothetical protein